MNSFAEARNDGLTPNFSSTSRSRTSRLAASEIPANTTWKRIFFPAPSRHSSTGGYTLASSHLCAVAEFSAPVKLSGSWMPKKRSNCSFLHLWVQGSRFAHKAAAVRGAASFYLSTGSDIGYREPSHNSVASLCHIRQSCDTYAFVFVMMFESTVTKNEGHEVATRWTRPN